MNAEVAIIKTAAETALAQAFSQARGRLPGDGAIAAHSIDEIVSFLGGDFRRKLKPLAESRWAHDPFARGSYSHALPGHAGKRAVLAAPVDSRLFFAGEATSPNFFSTAHGARDSGERAAGEVVRLLAMGA